MNKEKIRESIKKSLKSPLDMKYTGKGRVNYQKKIFAKQTLCEDAAGRNRFFFKNGQTGLTTRTSIGNSIKTYIGNSINYSVMIKNEKQNLPDTK